MMSPKTKIAGFTLVVIGMVIGIAIKQDVGRVVHAQAQNADAMPRGRTPSAIVDGKYPASYFPNTEILGAAEMRITALGTGMPNQTRAAVSISYLVELGNGDKFLFDLGSGCSPTCSHCDRTSRSSTRFLPVICMSTT